MQPSLPHNLARYDAWGNLLKLGPDTVNQSAYIGCTQESGFDFSAPGLIGANNRINTSGYVYDAAGNLITSPGAGTVTFNAENQIVSAGGVTYTYDGDGKRVMKSSGTIYWYGGGSDPLQETDLTGAILFQHEYFNGMRIARWEWHSNCTSLDHYALDHLGNARFVWGCRGSGAGWDVSSFYPFGGERPTNYNCCVGNKYKFTSKERDSESGLDNFGARFDSSTLGRFMSPDPDNAGASDGNPQSWNAYSYALDNPLNVVDPDGRDPVVRVCDVNNQNCVKLTQAEYDEWRASFSGHVTPSGEIQTAEGKPIGTMTSYDDGAEQAYAFANDLFKSMALNYVFGAGEYAFGRFLGLGATSFRIARVVDRTKPTAAEAAMIRELEAAGHVVTRIPRGPGKTADFLVDGVETELKVLEGSSPTTVKNAIQKASKQGEKILIDARGTGLSADQVVNQIARAQGNIGGLEGRVTVLTKDGVVRF